MADAHEAPVAQSLVAKIVSSYVRKNRLAPTDLSALIDTVYRSLLALTQTADPEPERTPAIPIRRSVTPEYVVCLECGRRGTTLRRHLQSSHGLTRDEYRARWGLPPDYPLTAPAYSERRSALAKKIGLGQKQLGRRRRQAPQQPA
jgi:predicted transcriptional regulator